MLTTSFSSTFDNMTQTGCGSEVCGVRVETGATITTNIVSPDAPGFIYLFGANVENHGTLTSPAGEVALVAARAITLTPGAYAAARIPAKVLTDGA